MDERRLRGTSPFPFFSAAVPSLLPWEEESDCCLEYSTGGGLPEFWVGVGVATVADIARGEGPGADLGELLPLLLLDFEVGSREEDFSPEHDNKSQ